MKRKVSKYKHVVGGDIYDHYPLVFWYECFFCGEEFRREKGFRFQVQYNRPWVYSCATCSSSKGDVNQNMERYKLSRREIFKRTPL